MKFSALTLFFASACVSGTAGFSAGYLSSLGGSDYSAPVASSTPKKNYSLTSWTPTGERRQAPNNGEAAVLDAVATTDAATTSTTIEMTNFLRNEYDAWLAYYGKIADEQRFKIFKDNYIRQWQTDRVTGEYHLLNEYGDLTPEEYAQFSGGGAVAPTQPEAAAIAPPQPSSANTKPQVVKSLQSSFSGAFQSMSNPTHPYIQAESEPDDHDSHDKDFAVYRLNN